MYLSSLPEARREYDMSVTINQKNLISKIRAAEDNYRHWRKVAMHLAGGDLKKIRDAEHEIYKDL